LLRSRLHLSLASQVNASPTVSASEGIRKDGASRLNSELVIELFFKIMD
jgi:hypothetical protein